MRDVRVIRQRELHGVANARVHERPRHVAFKGPRGDHRIVRNAHGNLPRVPVEFLHAASGDGRQLGGNTVKGGALRALRRASNR